MTQQSHSPLHIVILAAGQGKRMVSARPKVLHPLAGQPLLERVILTAKQLHPEGIHVVYGDEQIRQALAHLSVQWVKQEIPRGTGDAVKQVLPHLPEEARVLVLYGDVPLLPVSLLTSLVESISFESRICRLDDSDFGQLVLLTAVLDDPYGYGRILRDVDDVVVGIVEERDARESQKEIREINTGILAAPAHYLRHWIKQLSPNNVQEEYYLTDIVAIAASEEIPIATHQADDSLIVMGVNDRQQLAQLERHYQLQQAKALMTQGVTFADPSRFDLRGEITAGYDVTIDIDVICEGSVTLGDHVTVGPYTLIRNSTIESGVTILSHCVIEGATIRSGARIGPFARIRPTTVLAENVHIGNFVEVKQSEVGQASKINHLSYIGDSEIGQRVNIGAGTITCNYDGANKHKTTLGNDVFVGSDTQLIAPVSIGDGATIGAGSTIAKEVPAHKLTLSRSQQQTIEHWKRPVKKQS